MYVRMCLCTCMPAPCASIQYACVTLVCVCMYLQCNCCTTKAFYVTGWRNLCYYNLGKLQNLFIIQSFISAMHIVLYRYERT